MPVPGPPSITSSENTEVSEFVKVQSTSISSGRVVKSSVPFVSLIITPAAGCDEHEIERELSAGIIRLLKASSFVLEHP